MHEMSSYTRPVRNWKYELSEIKQSYLENQQSFASYCTRRALYMYVLYTVHKINLLVSQVHKGRNILYHMKANRQRIALINSNTNKKTINPHKNNR